ncbi:Vacuolar fusion protein MON1 A [Dermatophagoides farinae]|uniref:Vacuolar fusion protein MON1 homolog n=1 Tax=Dermatophagoides farinae TaxID=6954 RepID=A0A922IDA1_DERFA|nr:Vacuolar fusion protein MON1 A [Dermatophagoides farinae]
MSIETNSTTTSNITSFQEEVINEDENPIETSRSSLNPIDSSSPKLCPDDHDDLDRNETIYIESDKQNINSDNDIDDRKNKDEELVVQSFESKLSIQSNNDNETTTNIISSNDWNLKTFLNEHSIHHNDIDVLIMSEAGKPIYCYSGRKDVTTLMGVCVALINYVIKTQNDQLKTIRTNNDLNINFAIRSPLVIVVVCRQLTCFDEYTLINQIHAQIISTITLKKLKSIFQQAPTYDLKRIIHKNDFKTLDILVKSITTPITELFPTYKNKRYKLMGGRIFNNVISFYTSSLNSIPRSSTSSSSSSNSFLSSSSSSSSLLGSNSNLNNNNNNTNSSSSLIFLYDHKPNVLSRVYVPIAIMNPNIREQINMIINQSVATNNDIVFTILFHIEDDEQLDGSGGGGGGGGVGNVQCLPIDLDSHIQWNHFNPNISSDYDDDDDDEDEDNDDENDSTTNDLYESFESSTKENYQKSDNHLEQQQQQQQQSSSSSSINRMTKNLKLISVCNHTNKFRINPLDIQLLYALIKASDSLLSSTETLWIPLCLSRVDANRFLHAHVSYLSKKYCLIILDVDHNNFEKCRQVKETINFKLDQIRLTEPMIGLGSNITELGQPHLQYLCHQTPKHCIVWQSSIQTEFSSLNYYLIERMQRSSLKTLWLRSMKEQCSLLGWQTATFQLYAQFDGFVTKQSALETVDTFIKWFKKEEDKLIIKD